ncbi:MAG: heat-inducible transcriptional repressor HrcA [Bacillaceae bacterium]|nr:heat-inducible transcriptional repressor HrcA [Bacillaceae bacterium]
MLTERQKKILNAIIDDYIRSAEPVGSRTISKRKDIGFSSATVRNEMADLEEMGYLEQPHTSAGRVPSQKGYRYYVDHLLKLRKLTAPEIMGIKYFFDQKFYEVEQVIQQTADILSQLTNYTSIVMGPEVFQAKLNHIQIIPISKHSAVAILVTDTGRVENKTIQVPEDISLSDIEKLVNLFNHKLKGVPLSQIRTRIFTEINRELRQHLETYDQAMEMISRAFDEQSADRIYLKGTTNIMNQPEFRDIDKVRGILELLERDDAVIRLLGQTESGLQVRIGQELDEEAVNNCSVITATYELHGNPVGVVGILGPTRMEYAKVIRILNHLTRDLSQTLNKFYED